MHSSLLTAGDSTTTLLLHDDNDDFEFQIQRPKDNFRELFNELEANGVVLAEYGSLKYEILIMPIEDDSYTVQFGFFLVKGQTVLVRLSETFTLVQLKELFKVN